MAVTNRTRLGLKPTRLEKHPLTKVTNEQMLSRRARKRMTIVIFLRGLHLLVVKKYDERQMALKEVSIGLTMDLLIMQVIISYSSPGISYPSRSVSLCSGSGLQLNKKMKALRRQGLQAFTISVEDTSLKSVILGLKRYCLKLYIWKIQLKINDAKYTTINKRCVIIYRRNDMMQEGC